MSNGSGSWMTKLAHFMEIMYRSMWVTYNTPNPQSSASGTHRISNCVQTNMPGLSVPFLEGPHPVFCYIATISGFTGYIFHRRPQS